jgi:hypothetical protein
MEEEVREFVGDYETLPATEWLFILPEVRRISEEDLRCLRRVYEQRTSIRYGFSPDTADPETFADRADGYRDLRSAAEFGSDLIQHGSVLLTVNGHLYRNALTLGAPKGYASGAVERPLFALIGD